MKKILCFFLTIVLLQFCAIPATAAVSKAKPKDDRWMLQLVNWENPVAENFVPAYEAVQNDFVMDERVAPVMRQMIADAQEAGVKLVVNSAYRSYKAQQRIYDAKIQEYLSLGYGAKEAQAAAGQYVAIPGYSEHQLGLAVDVVGLLYQESGGYIVDYAAEWLSVHAPEYGFIMRYPENKTEITHAAYEPWHFRYVGKTAAKEIAERGICLEEYLLDLQEKS